MVKLPSIETLEGRRALSFLAILGSCFVFTLFAAVGVWLVSGNARYTLILALAAHAQLLLGLSTFSFILGRKMDLSVGKDGAMIKDREEAAQTVADAAQEKADEIKEPPG